MSQQKSTSFSAAKVANFGVVMVEMIKERLRMEREIRRLRHHVSVLSNRNHRLVEDGKSRAVAPIASATSLCVCRRDEAVARGEEVAMSEAEVAEKVATVEAEDVAGVMARSVAESEAEVAKKVEAIEAEDEAGVVVRSVGEVEEKVALPKVRLPKSERVGEKKRRLESD